MDGILYEYLTGANGVFIHAKRQGMEVMIPVMTSYEKPIIRGLEIIKPFVKIPGLVPAGHLQTILRFSRFKCPDEVLFYILHDVKGWKTLLPAQHATHGSVKPDDAFNLHSTRAIVEMHSHNTMSAHFSSMDDVDETGFKLFAVVGRIDQERVELQVRVGVYGHFYNIPSGWVFQSPIEVDDVNRD